MKQLLTILFIALLGSQQIFAQASKKLDALREKVLPQYSTYFSQAETTENGQLNLKASDTYSVLPAASKKSILSTITKAWQDSLVIVLYGSKRELWGWNARTSETKLLDEWDMAIPISAPIITVADAQKTNLHPWFLYLGGQFMGDNNQNINLSFNTRVGFFLLLNRWDLAATLSAGSSGNVEATGTPYSNIGLMSRVHFPIKKYSISPNIGAEMILASFGETESTFVPSLVLGFSWFVGIGRVDIGIKIGDITSGMGGYSMYPGMKRAK
jgi:hypothetical protein